MDSVGYTAVNRASLPGFSNSVAGSPKALLSGKEQASANCHRCMISA